MAETPIYDDMTSTPDDGTDWIYRELLMERWLEDPEGRALVHAILERKRKREYVHLANLEAMARARAATDPPHLRHWISG